jgi:hypothetical protein
MYSIWINKKKYAPTLFRILIALQTQRYHYSLYSTHPLVSVLPCGRLRCYKWSSFFVNIYASLVQQNTCLSGAFHDICSNLARI